MEYSWPRVKHSIHCLKLRCGSDQPGPQYSNQLSWHQAWHSAPLNTGCVCWKHNRIYCTLVAPIHPKPRCISPSSSQCSSPWHAGLCMEWQRKAELQSSWTFPGWNILLVSNSAPGLSLIWWLSKTLGGVERGRRKATFTSWPTVSRTCTNPSSSGSEIELSSSRSGLK